MKLYTKSYKESITIENLLRAWEEFLRGKRKRADVASFQVHLMDNIYSLYNELICKCYRHGGYEAFNISDPKPRSIHKAVVRDRLVHHLLYNEIYPYFEKRFVFDSYSCRNEKGTHKALYRFRQFARIVSKNNTQVCWVLKCDIRKFFASIDHTILKNILKRHINEPDMLFLLEQIVDSFCTEGKNSVGLPLGNLTSQLLVNIYMNEFDQFVKKELKTRYYIRYADDFVVMSIDKNELEKLVPVFGLFLDTTLKLSLHPDKLFIKTLYSGVDFLGWVNFPNHRTLRRATRRRMMKRLTESNKPETIASYKGMLSHGNAYKTEGVVNKILEESLASPLN